MQLQVFRFRAFARVAVVALLAFSGWANADPPARVGRLGYLAGAVSFSPAGEDEWVQATLNRPLGAGDRLWTDTTGARAEIQVDSAMVRVDAGTSLSVLNLDNQITQLQLTQGIVNVRVRRLERNQLFEVDTPNLAFTLRQPGAYRIEVDPEGYATTIIMRAGQGEAYGEGADFLIDAHQLYRFTGTGLRDYRYVDAPRLDEFDLWANARDRRYDNSVSARYVSPNVVGYQELDGNGSWRVDPDYGNVWVPDRVVAGWAPFRDGHWAWVDPWGWTWVDDAPWGFAVSHYGRWAYLQGSWAWVPGPLRTQAYYAPALVAFVGGSNFRLTVSSGNVAAVAWFPLAPSEVYRPPYAVSRGYFENINRSNTVVNSTVINNTYNSYNTTNITHVTNVTNVVYANRNVPGAVVAVPTNAFVQSQPVSTTAMRVSRDVLAGAAVAHVAPLAPTERSVRGATPRGDTPPPRVFERPVVARTEPAAAHIGFAAQHQQLNANPGRPLDDAARKELKPVAATPMPIVKLVAPPVAPPTPPAPLALPTRPDQAGQNFPERRASAVAPASGAPVAMPAARPLPIAPPSPPPSQPRPQPPQLPQSQPQPPQRAIPAAAVAAQAAPSTPAIPLLEQRAKSEQGGKVELRAQPVLQPRPPEPPQRMPEARPLALPVAPAPPVKPVPPVARPEPAAAAAKQMETRAAPATPQAAPRPAPLHEAPPVAPPNARSPGPAASKPVDKKNERAEEGRKQ